MADRVSLITGGTGGLGMAVTRSLLLRGDAVVVTFVIPSEADELERTLQGTPESELLTLVRADVTERAGIDKGVSAALSRHGRLDHFVGLVGGWAGGQNVWETDDMRWERMLELNLHSAFLGVRAASAAMIEEGYGRIVLVSSRAARTVSEGQAAYSVAKAAVISLVEASAAELRDHGVTVNCILPSVIDTPTNRQAMPNADQSRWVKPQEVAAVIAFLTSEAASAVSGAAIPVYGRA